jgi:hypothetical protein
MALSSLAVDSTRLLTGVASRSCHVIEPTVVIWHGLLRGIALRGQLQSPTLAVKEVGVVQGRTERSDALAISLGLVLERAMLVPQATGWQQLQQMGQHSKDRITEETTTTSRIATCPSLL